MLAAEGVACARLAFEDLADTNMAASRLCTSAGPLGEVASQLSPTREHVPDVGRQAHKSSLWQLMGCKATRHRATCWWPSTGRGRRHRTKFWCAPVQQLSSSKWTEQLKAICVQVHVAVLRVPQKQSDILVSLNTPTLIHSLSSSAEHAGAGPVPTADDAGHVFSAVLQSLHVHDWGLFGA